MTTSLLGPVPSAISELAMFANTVSLRTPGRWACDVGNRTYTGGQFADNRALVKFGGALSLVGRASVPRPMKFSGDAPGAPLVATPGKGNPDGNVPGGFRYYRFAWAKEQAAIGVVAGGDESLGANDAGHPSQQVPLGMFGPLCEDIVEVEIANQDDDNRVALAIVAANITVPADYGITHAYIFASLEKDGIYRYVGKVAYTASGPSFGTLYDTLSDEALGERVQHTGLFLTMPTLSAATRFRSRWVGVVGGQQSRMGSADNHIYLKMTAGSRMVRLVDADGNGPSAPTLISPYARFPRYWEHGGVLLDIEGDDFRYEVDQIDENDRSMMYLVTPWRGPDTPAGSGTAFSAEGANLLAVGIANLQQQELVSPTMFLRGDDYFGGTIVTCIDTPRGDALLVFGRSGVYSIRGLPEVETVEGPPAGSPDIRPVSLTEGASGPYAVCHGPGNTVFALGDTALYSVSTEAVTEIGGELVRDFLSGLPGEDKERARLVYDGGRRLLYVLLPYLEDRDRPGFNGLDARELCLVLDLDAGAFTVWNGGRWRACATCDPTVAATGPQVLFQDNFGDVVVLSPDALVDKALAGVGGVGGPGVAGALGGNHFAFAEPPASLLAGVVRGQYMAVDTYTSPISPAAFPGIESAESVAVDGEGRVETTGWPTWSAPDQSQAGWGQLGGIVVEWQSGALEPSAPGGRMSVRSVSMDVDASAGDGQGIAVEVFTSGITGSMPPAAAPTVQRYSTVGQLQTAVWQPLPVHQASRRVGVGFRYLQRAGDGAGSGSRVRVNAMTIETGER